LYPDPICTDPAQCFNELIVGILEATRAG
jgi:hypothetical protein